MKPDAFEFTSYQLKPQEKEIWFTYTQKFSGRESVIFTERLILDQTRPLPQNIPPALLDELLSGLHLALGLSYYKIFCPSVVALSKPLTKDQARFWSTVYRKGLGEFLFRNNLDPQQVAVFPATATSASQSTRYPRKRRALLGIGGGKDSLVAAELLKQLGIETHALVTETNRGHELIDEVVKTLKTQSLRIKRVLDPQVFSIQSDQTLPQSYNGHIPISAIFAWVGVLAGVMYDYEYPVVGNEYSSNFGNTEYKGDVINHQWSKSGEFEELFQTYIRKYVTPDVVYSSILRPFYELRIAKMFARYPKYFSVFSSCNQVHRISSLATRNSQLITNPLWCGVCPKCAFVFLILSPFIPKRRLVKIFGKNMLADSSLLPLYTDILGFGTMKPFDCVGTFDEARAALFLSSSDYKHDSITKTLIGKIEHGAKLAAQALATQKVQTVPPLFVFAGMEHALIVGYGAEGIITKKYLKKRYPFLHLTTADKKQGDHYLDNQKKFDIAIKTPGIPARLITIPYTTATNLFFAETNNPVIGVTGSKGKSTTASLIAHILTTAGREVKLLGNIGVPMLSVLLKQPEKPTTYVVELSSYQLEDLRQSPQISVVTSLFPEHMDYHGGTEKYYAAKQHITAFQKPGDVFIYNPDFETLTSWAKSTSAQEKPYESSLPVPVEQIPLLGKHNQQNVKAAVTVARTLGISDAEISRAITSFKPLPHRLENIGTYQGITFYDDAISTSPESTIEAIKSLPQIGTILLGGEDRGYDFSGLEKAVVEHGISNVVLFPHTGERMFKNSSLNILRTSRMSEAVAFAYKHTKAGGICLLSTASPSYSLWKNFEEKGAEFAKYVKKLRGTKLTVKSK